MLRPFYELGNPVATEESAARINSTALTGSPKCGKSQIGVQLEQ